MTRWDEIVKVVGTPGTPFSLHDESRYLPPIEQVLGCVRGWRDQIKNGEVTPFDLWKGRYRPYFDGESIVIWGHGSDMVFGTADDEFGVYVGNYSELQRLHGLASRPRGDS